MPIARFVVAGRKMESAKIMHVKPSLWMSWEDQFREQFPDARVEEEIISEHLTRYRVVVGNSFHCSESGIRELAFKYALEDVREGKLQIPPRIEQLEL